MNTNKNNGETTEASARMRERATNVTTTFGEDDDSHHRQDEEGVHRPPMAPPPAVDAADSTRGPNEPKNGLSAKDFQSRISFRLCNNSATRNKKNNNMSREHPNFFDGNPNMRTTTSGTYHDTVCQKEENVQEKSTTTRQQRQEETRTVQKFRRLSLDNTATREDGQKEEGAAATCACSCRTSHTRQESSRNATGNQHNQLQTRSSPKLGNRWPLDSNGPLVVPGACHRNQGGIKRQRPKPPVVRMPSSCMGISRGMIVRFLLLLWIAIPCLANPQNTNAYRILGVTRDASQDEIRSKYRKLCLQYHPDKHGNKTEKEKKRYVKNFFWERQKSEIFILCAHLDWNRFSLRR